MTASGAPIQPIVFIGLRGMGKMQWGWLNSEYL